MALMPLIPPFSPLISVASGLARAFKECKPDIVMYNAGTDTLDGDPLGRCVRCCGCLTLMLCLMDALYRVSQALLPYPYYFVGVHQLIAHILVVSGARFREI